MDAHKKMLQEFLDASQKVNAAAKQHGANSPAVDELWKDAVHKLGKATGAYKALEIAGLIKDGSTEERELIFLLGQVKLLLGE